MSDHCREELGGVMETILLGIGGKTKSRQMSVEQLLNDETVLKATMLDPRFCTMYYVSVPADKIKAAFSELNKEIVAHAEG
jgi:hypothetical protein